MGAIIQGFEPVIPETPDTPTEPDGTGGEGQGEKNTDRIDTDADGNPVP